MGNSGSTGNDNFASEFQDALVCCTSSDREEKIFQRQTSDLKGPADTGTSPMKRPQATEARRRSSAKESESDGFKRTPSLERRSSSVAKFINPKNHTQVKSPQGAYTPTAGARRGSNTPASSPAPARTTSTCVSMSGTLVREIDSLHPAFCAGQFHNFHLEGETIDKPDEQEEVDPMSRPVFFRSASSEGVPKAARSPSMNASAPRRSSMNALNPARKPSATSERKEIGRTRSAESKSAAKEAEAGESAENPVQDAQKGKSKQKKGNDADPSWSMGSHDMKRTRSDVFQQMMKSGEVKFCGTCHAILSKKDRVCHECNAKYDETLDTRSTGPLINGELMLHQLKKYDNVKHISLYERDPDAEIAKPHSSQGDYHGVLQQKMR